MASLSDENSSFLSGINSTYIAELYQRYLKAPSAVNAEWAEIFDLLGDDESVLQEDIKGASWAPRASRVIGSGHGLPSISDALDKYKDNGTHTAQHESNANIRRATLDSVRALMLIRNYRVRGHLSAQLDPLKLNTRLDHPEISPSNYGFTEEDLDRPIFLNYVLGFESATLREIITICREAYCGHLGIEFMHIQDPQEKSWLQERAEMTRGANSFSVSKKKAILKKLTESECFERFLDQRHPGSKRFGLDGGESAVPLVEHILRYGSKLGLEEVVVGMAHRGRLNFLFNIMGKPFKAIFKEFSQGTVATEGIRSFDDIKYHLGASTDRDFNDRSLHLSLTANPSHLEAVNVVALGKARAKQDCSHELKRSKVMCILMHGDAAMAGQGIVPETLALSQLPGYRTGGTVHLIINNQIGFTTSPLLGRSSPYCSDVAKMVGAPILHVNGDCPESCIHAAQIAIEYRQKFEKDVFIDMWCYRRHGHSEIDEPKFTQPLMYKTIDTHKSARQLYAEKLVNDRVISQEEADTIEKEFMDSLSEDAKISKNYVPNKEEWLEGDWQGLKAPSDSKKEPETGIDKNMLQKIGKTLGEVPKNFAIHLKLERLLEHRRAMLETEQNFDWATAEALAFGSLLCEANPVRLSGEDSQRGTFSQRHALLIDQKNETPYIQLNHIQNGQALLSALDSPLSEFGVLGFEYGYSLAQPNTLVLWEAQFGDFVNGAQVIIDQFIASGEKKWLRMSGLVMLLPHGYEGQGPEHSSARPERFLLQCAQQNWQVCNATTPANYFHLLRRQIHRDYRKPLILFTPKSLLRHKLCVSDFSEMQAGTCFKKVLLDGRDENLQDTKIKRAIFCTGKVYYDLYKEAEKRDDIYLARIEQLYPWPEAEIVALLGRFQNAKIIWCQEEPENMGYWQFTDRRLETAMQKAKTKQARPLYVGREASASPATGIPSHHKAELEKLMKDALLN